MECETFWRIGIVEMVVVLHLDVGDVGKEEDDRENDDHAPDEGVRNPKILASGALARRVLGIEKHAARDRSEEQDRCRCRIARG